jgi:Uma2 family endonuclease
MSEPALSLHPTYTWEDFLALPDDDRRELVDGELVELEVSTDPHEHIVARVIFFLTLWGRPRRARVHGSNYKIRISARRGFFPDVQLYLADNPARGQKQGLEHGHPDLVVEVISPGTGRVDRLLKRDAYAGLGVPEYWIIDPELRMLERLILRDGLYAIAEGHSDDATFRPASFKGLEIPLAELWEE